MLTTGSLCSISTAQLHDSSMTQNQSPTSLVCLTVGRQYNTFAIQYTASTPIPAHLIQAVILIQLVDTLTTGNLNLTRLDELTNLN